MSRVNFLVFVTFLSLSGRVKEGYTPCEHFWVRCLAQGYLSRAFMVFRW